MCTPEEVGAKRAWQREGATAVPAGAAARGCEAEAIPLLESARAQPEVDRGNGAERNAGAGAVGVASQAGQILYW